MAQLLQTRLRASAATLFLCLGHVVSPAASATETFGAADKAEEAPPQIPGSPSAYRQLAGRFAMGTDLPAEVADAVMAVESGYNPDEVGSSGEIGLMQVLPSTARMLGFTGTLAELAVPETNTRYGVAYLAQAWRLADGDLCTAVMKYRAGHGETRFSARSVDYCLSVRAKLAARGYPVKGVVPMASFGEPTKPRSCRKGCFMLAGSSNPPPNFAALNKHLSSVAWQANTHTVHGL
jgi:soluble lytic murein transglycosylase-like protein